ncbi:MAG: hypothetical protein ACI4SR_02130 [Faecalibacillus sp.]
MSIKENVEEMMKSMENLEKTGIYDVEKYSYSLLHQTSQLEYFYCHLVKENHRECDETFYHVFKRPKEHQLAYYNIGRGFPKELMDGHWCYVLKDLGYKMLVIPCTSLKGTECNPEFEMDIDIKMYGKITKSRIQLSDIRSIDVQRIDLRKPFCKVLTDKKEIMDFIIDRLFQVQ